MSASTRRNDRDRSGLPDVHASASASTGYGAASRVDFETLRRELDQTKTLLAMYAKRDDVSAHKKDLNDTGRSGMTGGGGSAYGSPSPANRLHSHSPHRGGTAHSSASHDPYVMQGMSSHGRNQHGQAALSRWATSGPAVSEQIYQPSEGVEGLSPRRPLTASPSRAAKSPAERLASLRRRLDERDRRAQESTLHPSLDATFQRGRVVSDNAWAPPPSAPSTPNTNSHGAGTSIASNGLQRPSTSGSPHRMNAGDMLNDPRSPHHPSRVAAMDYTAANLRRQLDIKENTIERLREENERLRAHNGLDPNNALEGTVVLQLPNGMRKSDLRRFDSLMQVLVANKLYNPNHDDMPNVGDDAEMKSFIATTTQGPVNDGHAISAKSNWRSALRAISSYASTQRRTYALERMSAPDISAQLEEIDSWDFDVFALADITSQKPLVLTSYKILQQHQLLQKFRLAGEKVHALLDKIESLYLDSNPYHNSIHASDVVQATHWFLSHGGIGRHVTNRDILAAVLAALAHDVEHPGVNNNFLIATRDEKAILYNDMSVLEHHHAATLFRLLQDDRFNVLENLTADEYKEVRQTVVEMILGTDLAQHFTSLTKFEALVKVGEINWQDLQTRRLILKITLHCADISNPCRIDTLSHRWSACVQEEFFAQGDRERQMSLPISPFCDRYKPNVGKCQRGFIDFIVSPLFKVYAEMLNDGAMLLGHLEDNRAHWLAIEEREAAESGTTTNGSPTSKEVGKGDSKSSSTPAPQPPGPGAQQQAANNDKGEGAKLDSDDLPDKFDEA